MNPRRKREAQDRDVRQAALLAWYCCGVLGGHRFYLGHYRSAAALAATFLVGVGLCFVDLYLAAALILVGVAWCAVDLFLILTGSLKPAIRNESES